MILAHYQKILLTVLTLNLFASSGGVSGSSDLSNPLNAGINTIDIIVYDLNIQQSPNDSTIEKISDHAVALINYMKTQPSWNELQRIYLEASCEWRHMVRKKQHLVTLSLLSKPVKKFLIKK